jgi:tetratricopeptide (TPR) repeat protein
MNQTTAQAIQATLKGDWKAAIALNIAILEENSKDLETLNRLAFAYTALGKLKEAKSTYQKVLKIDKLNPIALKNMKRLGETATRKVTNTTYNINTSMFLEEVGKTKVIVLLNTAPSKVLRTLQVGQPVEIVIKRSKIFALDESKQFIGMLPDNISCRLIKFMKGGNKYEGNIKSITEHEVSIFVKETKRAARYKNQPSFVMSDLPKNAFTLPKKSKNHDADEESETSEE